MATQIYNNQSEIVFLINKLGAKSDAIHESIYSASQAALNTSIIIDNM